MWLRILNRLKLLLLDEEDLGSDWLLAFYRHLDPESVPGAREQRLDQRNRREQTLSDIVSGLRHDIEAGVFEALSA